MMTLYSEAVDNGFHLFVSTSWIWIRLKMFSCFKLSQLYRVCVKTTEHLRFFLIHYSFVKQNRAKPFRLTMSEQLPRSNNAMRRNYRTLLRSYKSQGVLTVAVFTEFAVSQSSRRIWWIALHCMSRGIGIWVLFVSLVIAFFSTSAISTTHRMALLVLSTWRKDIGYCCW